MSSRLLFISIHKDTDYSPYCKGEATDVEKVYVHSHTDG